MVECVACKDRQRRKAADPKRHRKLNPLCPVHQRPKAWPLAGMMKL